MVVFREILLKEAIALLTSLKEALKMFRKTFLDYKIFVNVVKNIGSL